MGPNAQGVAACTALTELVLEKACLSFGNDCSLDDEDEYHQVMMLMHGVDGMMAAMHRTTTLFILPEACSV